MPWQHIVIMVIWFLGAGITIGSTIVKGEGPTIGPLIMVTLLTALLITGDNALLAGP